jgi:hypothetical protein
VKQLLVHLVPEGRWIVENQPSPSVTNIIREGIPAILERQGKEALVQIGETDPLLKEIKKGIILRNETVHRESPAPKHETLVGVLDATRDFLWLFDAYMGHRWALDNLRSETRALWLPSTK